MESIKEGKIYLRQEFAKGTDCPCCGQFVKLYKRKLNSGMSLFLIGLYKLSKNNGVRCFKNQIIMRKMNLNTSSLDYSIIKHFDLIEEEIDHETEKKNSGYWKITQKGIEFIEQKIEVPSHVHIYNGKVLGFADTTTNIITSLGNKFSYNELMNNN